MRWLSVHIVTILADTVCKYTVNKLRSINLLFFERKIVNVGAEKIHHAITLTWKILALLLLMRKITQLQKNGKQKL